MRTKHANDCIRFRGFEVPRVDAACVDSVARVASLERDPLLVMAIAGTGGRENFYQRLD